MIHVPWEDKNFSNAETGSWARLAPAATKPTPQGETCSVFVMIQRFVVRDVRLSANCHACKGA